MKVVVWHESYLAGGADWSLIDLVTAWPEPMTQFVIYINETHEGVRLVRERLANRATVVTFQSPFEIARRVEKPRVLRVAAWLFAIAVSLIRYRKLFRNLSCDLLLFNNGGYPGGLSNYVVAWMLRKRPIQKRVMIVRNYPAISYRASRLMQITRKICHRTLDRMVAVSYSLRDALVDKGGIDPALIDVIHNGISLENKSARGSASSTDDTAPGLTAGIIGTLEERKGHRVLFHAWAHVLKQFPDARLWIVGSHTSGNRAALLDLARELGILDSLRWQDFTHDIGDIYRQLDVVVMPSQESESFGRVVVEAMAFGKPIIGSRIGGIPEIIASGEDGWLVDPRDARSIADHIIELFSSRDARSEMGARGKQKYETQFSAHRMAERYHDLISRI